MLWLRAGQDPGEHSQGLREKRLHLRYTLESGKHLDILGRKGCGRPHSLFLNFRGVIFPLAGVPLLEGYANERERVRTQKVVQSRKWRENPLSNSHWARDFSCPVALVKPITRDPSSWAKQVVVAEVK